MDADHDMTEQLQAVLADLGEVVGAVDPTRGAEPTPCSAYDVNQLLDHTVGWLTVFAAGFADPGGQAPPLVPDAARAADPAAGVARAAAQIEAALRAGAAGRPLRLGEAAMPGEMALGMILWEYQVHGWDLARATGHSWTPDVEGVEASLAFVPAMLTEDYQGEGKPFGPRVAVADDATPFDRLLGLSGRDPAWTPSRGR